MKIGVFGVGLIGGSLSIQAKKHFPNSKIFGFDLSKKNLDRALKLGLIDTNLKSNEIKGLDLILVTVPVNSVISIVFDLFDQIHKDSLIIDFSSTKKEICDALSNHPKRDQFLATHPIAGTEFSGPDSALENLFYNKVQILCETNKTRKSLLDFAIKWFSKIGMKIQEIDPIKHDLQVAYVSHLSHISSFMLGKTVIERSKNKTTILNLAGSGFESTVRLAKSSPDMWVPIFKQNRLNIIEILSQYIDNLNRFKNLIEESKYEEIYDQMKSINSIKTILDGIINSANK
ncbi:MAG: prephenate dehydrogenase [Flavobacteriaceae bacterium]|nr:prephenate dehydrogenase [Flavobacteriaceae bacterium]